jgi:hypothetical protein
LDPLSIRGEGYKGRGRDLPRRRGQRFRGATAGKVTRGERFVVHRVGGQQGQPDFFLLASRVTSHPKTQTIANYQIPGVAPRATLQGSHGWQIDSWWRVRSPPCGLQNTWCGAAGHAGGEPRLLRGHPGEVVLRPGNACVSDASLTHAWMSECLKLRMHGSGRRASGNAHINKRFR